MNTPEPIEPDAVRDGWECACGADVDLTERDNETVIVHHGPHDDDEPLTITKRGPLVSIPITDEMRELFPHIFAEHTDPIETCVNCAGQAAQGLGTGVFPPEMIERMRVSEHRRVVDGRRFAEALLKPMPADENGVVTYEVTGWPE